MQTDHLHYILEIARQGSINKAAEALRFPRPHLSRILSNYEQELGVPLFERLPRGVRPTPEGEYALARIEEALAILDDLPAHFQGQAPAIFPQYRDVVTFFCPTHGRSRRQIGPLLERFQEQFINVPLIQRAVLSPLPLEELAATPNALALVMRSPDIPEIAWDPIEPLQFTPLAQTSLVALVAPDHPLSENKSVSLKSLCKKPLILVSNDNNDTPFFYDLLHRYGTPNIKQLISGNMPLLQELIASGRYVTLGVASNQVDDTLKQIPLREALPITIGLLYDPKSLSVVPLRTLASMLLALFDKPPLTENGADSTHSI